MDIVQYDPDILIHAAWNGVKSENRDNWIEQEKNLSFLVSLLEIVKKTNIKKIIALGSQAEYGNFEGSVDETFPCNPTSAYGANKLCASMLLKSFAELNQLEWYWIRIFSVFGKRENNNWLIPTVISKLLLKEPISLTACEQKYNYLYIADFINQFLSIVQTVENKSGIFNLCNTESISLRELLLQITSLMGVSDKLLLFGKIPYWSGQNMLIAGDNSKFKKCFPLDTKDQIGLKNGLIRTIEYHKIQIF